MTTPSPGAAAQLAIDERARWQPFYADRQRACSFFVNVPDENLAEWVEQGLIGGQRALDIGCGNARNSIHLASRGFSVDAVDQSASAAAWAREEVAKAQAPVTVHCTSIFDHPLQPATYDLVYDGGCFHHIPPHQRSAYVELVATATKPGGMFGLVCFTPDAGSGYSDEEVYERRSLGWGLGYDEARLREIWGEAFDFRVVRRMRELPADARHFGRDFLWTVLAQKR